MRYLVQHQIYNTPTWYTLETAKDLNSAKRRATDYTLDHGGYGRVMTDSGEFVYFTYPQGAR